MPLAPRVLPDLTVPSQPFWCPHQSCPWPQDPISAQPGTPDLVGATQRSPSLPHVWASNPWGSLVSSPVSVLTPFCSRLDLLDGPWLWSIGCCVWGQWWTLIPADPVIQHPSVRELRRTPASPPSWISPHSHWSLTLLGLNNLRMI